jgi:transcriptional regulator of met regulon
MNEQKVQGTDSLLLKEIHLKRFTSRDSPQEIHLKRFTSRDSPQERERNIMRRSDYYTA